MAKDVNWNQVQLEYQKWDYKHEGLTGAGAAIIALALAAVTGGAGAGIASALSGTAVTGISATMANAAFLSLATQASVSLVNNKGNLGKTFKDLGRSSTVKKLATAVITAGVADKIGASSALQWSDSATLNNLTVNLANAGSSAVISTAINGGSLGDSLESAIIAALVQTAHGAAASKIKGLDNHYIAHKVAHAMAGCAAAAANKGKCQDGAIGAAVGEIVGEKLLNGRNVKNLNPEEYKQILAYSRLVAGTAAGLAGGDVNVAANTAKTALENNLLAFNPKSNPKAKKRFNDKVKNELDGKFELKGTGKFNNQGYEIITLVPIGNATTANLNAKQLAFYNMLNNIIQDKTGTAQITLVYNDGSTAGGSWITGRFDVGDMEKLDANKIVLTGNALIAHEFNEQIVKDKFHLIPLQGKEDKYYNFAHELAVKKEINMMKDITSIADNAKINGVEYSRIYYNHSKKQMLGVNIGTFMTTPTGLMHNFDPKQTIIKPNSNGMYIIETENQLFEFIP
ncbi:DUF637 domain-containing protein [Uruburuella testudinis]|uniref:DUF637 domain-containing protein n=1 Tax=Uruburuella testudinis TaxID=1282863 RepID=A0ABY4DUX0_9NEIS|nr:DUF637 domain-containing protein [Uruburuella testudinis]UOO82470.1 DUF637 domain-containing protein [Uruburuella testudinis]